MGKKDKTNRGFVDCGGIQGGPTNGEFPKLLDGIDPDKENTLTSKPRDPNQTSATFESVSDSSGTPFIH